MERDLTAYYARRAREYERIYEKPERQDELAILRTRLPALTNPVRGTSAKFISTRGAMLNNPPPRSGS